MSGKLVTPAELDRADPAKVWWVEFLRWVALAVFVALPFFAFFFQAFAAKP